MPALTLRYYPYTLELKHQFTVSAYSRATTPIMLVTIKYQDFIGYGEASMPPYLGETQQSVALFLSKVDLSGFTNPLEIDEILDYVDSLEPENNAAKASIDIALHDLVGKITGKPLYELWNLNPSQTPLTSLTVGIDKPEIVAQKIKEAPEFEIIKVKLGTANDKKIIEAVRSVTKLPLMVDVNQGWNIKEQALEMAHWLKERGVILLEQPLPKEKQKDLEWLSKRSPLPIIADEGIKRMDELQKYWGLYNGINVKLMKSTGLREAKKMLEFTKRQGLITMIGCMTESSCGVAAASHLSPLCQFADLDGPFLTKNNPFEDLIVKNGRLQIPYKPGIGVDIKHILGQ
jgi:L-alanine-DL-glutamate epimerase-like enolase superfamily enzyme